MGNIIYCNKQQKQVANKNKILIVEFIIVHEHNINYRIPIEPDYILFRHSCYM